MKRSAWPAPLRRAVEVPRFLWHLACWGRPSRALLFGPLSLGDDLLCTTVLHEARRRGQLLTMMTARPELFLGNPDPARLLPIDAYYIRGVKKLGAEIIHPHYTRPHPTDPHRDLLPSRHIIAEMCHLAGLTGTVTLRPYLKLTADEREAGRRVERQIAIHSTGLGAAIPYVTKEWGADRFASVVGALGQEFNFVQLGSASDPALPGALDLRGRTNLREAAAVLSQSVCFVGLEGFLVHLARAVDCPSVVLFGGRAGPETFGYPANINLSTPVECSPCGLREGCPHEMKCMTPISVEHTVAAIREIIARPPGPLAVATASLP